MGVLLSLTGDLLLKVKFLPKYACCKVLIVYLAVTPTFPSSCPSLVYVADVHCIYKSNYPLFNKEMSFEGKHCKIKTVVLSRSAQAVKLK